MATPSEDASLSAESKTLFVFALECRPVSWAILACLRNEVRREACPFSAEYQGKEKPRSMVTHGEVFFSSFSAGKHSGLSPKYEILRLACHCERAEHRPSAGDWQALFHRAQSFFDEE